MPLYKYAKHLAPSDDEWFDEIHGPGALPPCSGIYRCEGCAKEIVVSYGHPLPPQNHHQHKPGQSEILWRLIVW
jgi:hypothetical protein